MKTKSSLAARPTKINLEQTTTKLIVLPFEEIKKYSDYKVSEDDQTFEVIFIII